jgi:transposase-like protein
MSESQPETLLEAVQYFSDADRCQDFMVAMRWPKAVVTCPTCGRDDVRFISTRRMFECKDKHARRQFSVKVGSIFEDSPISLSKWLPAMWLIANDKNGISSYELGRALGVTQTTAWFMLHRIRLAMQSDDYTKLDGTIEVDETFIGGKARFMHRDRRARTIKGTGGAGKVAVMGRLDRHGPDGHSTVRTEVLENTRRSSLSPRVRRHVVSGSEVNTDALKSYADLDADYIHGVIDHAETYVQGKVHTNGIENFWSLLKRAIKGTYISVEPFHLFRYLDEEAFRFNSRQVTDGERFLRLARRVTGKRLPFSELTAATARPT